MSSTKSPYKQLFTQAFALLMLVLVLPDLATGESKETSVVRFMQLGDPQFGYGLDMKRNTSARMKTITDQIKTIQPDFLVIPGDLVQDRTIAQHQAFKKSIRNIDVPVLMTPGNHDLENIKDLKKYREKYGNDYSVKTVGSVTIIMLNSEILRNTKISSVEYHWQWDWLENEIDRYMKNPVTDKSIISVSYTHLTLPTKA